MSLPPVNELEVWLDCDLVEAPCRVGRLFHDRGNIRFVYDDYCVFHTNVTADSKRS